MLVVTPTPCEVITVPLDAGPSPLCLNPASRAAWLTFTLEGVPLGHRVLASGEFPLSAGQVWTLATEAMLPGLYELCVRNHEPRAELVSELAAADPLAVFRRQRDGQSAPQLIGQTSIVICTRERPESLRRCLQSLPGHTGEVIVVDNAPVTDGTRKLVSEFPNVRYVMEPRKGLSHARNLGVRESEGNVIAFTDDDVTVSASWLAELVRPFEDSRVDCTTGLVLPAELETQEQALFENWQSLHRGYEQRTFDSGWRERSRGHMAPVWDIGAGANMAIRRSAFAQHGLFDTRLGAGASGCSEDSEFWDRVLAAGGRCIYTPAAVVHHYHRADRRALHHQMRMYGRGHMAALFIQAGRRRDPRILRRILLDLPLHYFHSVFHSLSIPQGFPLWLASVRGYLEGFSYLLHARGEATLSQSPPFGPPEKNCLTQPSAEEVRSTQ